MGGETITSTTALAGAGGLDGTGGDQGTATASSTPNSGNGRYAYSPFNNDLEEWWSTSLGTAATDDDTYAYGHYEYLNFEFPYDVFVTNYKIWRRNSDNTDNPYEWILYGSTEDEPDNFIVIDERTNIAAMTGEYTDTTANENYEYQDYTVSTTPAAYRNIRMVISKSNANVDATNCIVSIGELGLYGFVAETLNVLGGANINSDLTVERGIIALGSKPTVYNSETNALAGAGGLNGTGGVQGTVTASSAFGSDDNVGSPIKAFNGTLTNRQDLWAIAETWDLDSDDAPAYHWIAFEFPYDVYITGYKIWPRYPSVTSNGVEVNSYSYWKYTYPPKRWKLQGSNETSPGTSDDSSDWTDIHEQDTDVIWYDPDEDSFSETDGDWEVREITQNSISNLTEFKGYDLSEAVGPYKHIRVLITDFNTNDPDQDGAYKQHLNIGEIGLYGFVSKVKVDCDAEITGNLTVGGKVNGDLEVETSLTVGDNRQITQTGSDDTYGDYIETVYGVAGYTTTLRSYYSNSSYRFFTISSYGASTEPEIAPFSMNNNSIFITEQTSGQPALDVSGDLTVGGSANIDGYLDFGTVGEGIIFAHDDGGAGSKPFIIARVGASTTSADTLNAAAYIEMTQNTVDIGSITSIN